MPLLAVMVIGKVPVAVAVPLRVAVPLPLSWNVTPLGSAPASVSEGVGVPVAVKMKLPATPEVNVVLLALVIVGATPVTPFEVRIATICMIHWPLAGAVAL